MSHVSRPFFEREATRKAIRTLASSDDLTLIVGAGASEEAGLPSWSELVMGLLREIAPMVRAPTDSEGAEDGVTAFCRALVASHGLMGAGSIARSWLGPSFEDAVLDQLYGRDPQPSPGQTDIGIARVRREFGRRCEIATLNYDRLIERALIDEGIRGVKTLVSSTRSRGAVVRHLHGVLTPTARRGSVVLSESDYFSMQVPRRWQERYVDQRLRASTCLFVGTSLTDPNLLRYLFRAKSSQGHYALFVQQSDEWYARRDLKRGLRQARDVASLQRWRDLGIEPLRPDFYVQSAQFVHELARARAQRRAYVPYGDRLRRWQREMTSGLMQRRSLGAFRESQESLHEIMLGSLEAIEEWLERRSRRPFKELLGLHLWARRPTERGFILLGSSDRIWRVPKAVQSVPIAIPSIWVCVEAFCRGRPMIKFIDHELASRWKTVLGIPIYLDSEPWGHLPVGVVTLASDKPRGQTALGRLGPLLTEVLAPFLADTAEEVLTP
jgi:hypothetical protein